MRKVDAAWRPVALLAGAVLLLTVASPVRAAPNNELRDGAVTPTNGTTATTFVFTVRYAGSNRATSVNAVAGSTVIPMTLTTGTDTDGTYRATTTLPQGRLSVVFQANVQGPNDPDDLPLHGVIVVASTAPRPTTQPTSVPTSTPGPTSGPSSTPRPPAPTNPPIAPTPVLVSQVPGSGSPTPGTASSPQTGGFSGGVVLTPRPTRTPAAGPAGGLADPQDEIWTIVAGGLVGTALLVMLAMLAILRDHSRQATEVRPAMLPPEVAAPHDALGMPRAEWDNDGREHQPIGTVDYEPPPSRPDD